MATRYREVVVEGPRGRGLGFLLGFLRGRSIPDMILDAEDEGFDCEPLEERLRELLHPGAETSHFLVPEDLSPALPGILHEAAAAGIPLRIVSERELAGARLGFEFVVYSREHAERLRAIFDRLPEGVKLTSGTRFLESSRPAESAPGAYAPVHGYTLTARGAVEGRIDGVLAVHRVCRDEELIRKRKLELV